MEEQNTDWHVDLYTVVIMSPHDGTSVPKRVGVYIRHKWCIIECTVYVG